MRERSKGGDMKVKRPRLTTLRGRHRSLKFIYNGLTWKQNWKNRDKNSKKKMENARKNKRNNNNE